MGLFYFTKMEETLKTIIRTLCLDFTWAELNEDRFKSICLNVVKSIYKTDIIINPKLYVRKQGIFQSGYVFEFNIIGNNSYGKWGVQNFIIEINGKIDITINLNFKE